MAFFRFQRASKTPDGSASADAAAPAADASIDELRQRARHRLIGTVILVLAAIIVFPLVFDTEQRPVVVDAPVIIADAGDLGAAPAQSSGSAAVTSTPDSARTGGADPAAAPDASPVDASVALSPIDAASEPAPDDDPDAVNALQELEAPITTDDLAAGPAKIRVTPPPQPASEADPRRATPEADSPGTALARQPSRDTAAPPSANANRQQSGDAEAQRALAALQGRGAPATTPAPASSAKEQFVVQVGAFSQQDQVRSARERAGRAGLQTYTQVINTPAGARTRVRVGPFNSRAAAEQARATLAGAGLPGQVLTY